MSPTLAEALTLPTAPSTRGTSCGCTVITCTGAACLPPCPSLSPEQEASTGASRSRTVSYTHLVIFQPFMSTKVEGTGLGLPIARRIFEEHGGWLHLHNAPGHGASFVMVLPVRKGDDVWLRSS